MLCSYSLRNNSNIQHSQWHFFSPFSSWTLNAFWAYVREWLGRLSVITGLKRPSCAFTIFVVWHQRGIICLSLGSLWLLSDHYSEWERPKLKANWYTHMLSLLENLSRRKHNYYASDPYISISFTMQMDIDFYLQYKCFTLQKSVFSLIRMHLLEKQN